MTKKQIIRSCLSANIGGRGTQNYGFTNKYVYKYKQTHKKIQITNELFLLQYRHTWPAAVLNIAGQLSWDSQQLFITQYF